MDRTRFTTAPSRAEVTISVRPRQAVKVALFILWDALLAVIRRDMVTFTMWDDS